MGTERGAIGTPKMTIRDPQNGSLIWVGRGHSSAKRRSRHQLRCRSKDRRSAIGEGSDPRQVAIGRACHGGPGQNENKGDHVAEGSHFISPRTI